jgi:hypothetical protein
VKLLTLEGANIHQATNQGIYPLSIACESYRLQIVYNNVDLTNITLSRYKTILNLPKDGFANTNEDEILESMGIIVLSQSSQVQDKKSKQ